MFNMKKIEIINCLFSTISKTQLLSFLVNTLTKTITIALFPFFLENIIKIATTDTNTAKSICIITLYFVAVGIDEIISIQNEKRMYTSFNAIRRSFISEVQRKIMNMDYQLFENTINIQKMYDALEGTGSNETGIEGIYHILFEMGWKIGSIIILLIYLSVVNVGLPIVFLVSLLLLNILKNKEKQEDILILEKTFPFKRKLVYYTYDTSDISYGKEKRIYKFYENIQRKYYEIIESFQWKLMEANQSKYVYFFLSSVVSTLKYILMIAIVFNRYIQGLSVEKVIGTITVMISLSTIADMVIEDFGKLKEEGIKANKTLSFLSNQTCGNSEKISIDKIYEIQFVDVCFHYPDNSDFNISNCSFKIKQGDSVAVIGLNGSGKTTLTKLMACLYKPSEGKILVNGMDISTIDLSKYFQCISYVEQEYHLVSLKISDFIAGGREQYQDKLKIENVLQQVGLLDKISKLPNGIESIMTKYLDDDGAEFSGGEIQKLYLARAMYHSNASFYIFDEPTSSLDALAEKQVYSAFHEISKNKISIFVTHKLSSTQFCNRIIVVKDGAIVEDGTKEELLRKKGFYYEMIHFSRNGEV